MLNTYSEIYEITSFGNNMNMGFCDRHFFCEFHKSVIRDEIKCWGTETVVKNAAKIAR
jgi:hypothetical protein